MVFSGVDDRAPIREFLEAVFHGVLDLSLHFARHLYRAGVARSERLSLIPVLQSLGINPQTVNDSSAFVIDACGQCAAAQTYATDSKLERERLGASVVTH